MERKDYHNRVEIVNALRNIGVEPHPPRAPVTNEIAEIVKSPDDFMGKDVALAGRVYSLRFHGKVAFSTIRSNGYQIQGFFKFDALGETKYKFLKKYVDRGDFLWIKGEITRTKKGELSILAKNIMLASKALYDLPHEWFGIEDTEKRYRQRYLDLILNKESFNIFVKRAQILREMRRYLWSKDFIEMETPVIQPVYGGANAKPFKTYVNAINRDYYLRISDELYLKRLIVGGYSRVFEISKDFRNEDIDTTHNPEFTMIEAYWAYADYNVMMNLSEDWIKYISRSKKSTCFRNSGERKCLTCWQNTESMKTPVMKRLKRCS